MLEYCGVLVNLSLLLIDRKTQNVFTNTNNSTTCKWVKLKVFLFLKHNANWEGLSVIEGTGVVGGENVKRKKSVMWYTKKWQVRYEEFGVMAFRLQNDMV